MEGICLKKGPVNYYQGRINRYYPQDDLFDFYIINYTSYNVEVKYKLKCGKYDIHHG